MKRVDEAVRAAPSDLMTNKDTTRIQQPWLTLARFAWIVIVVPSFALFVANIPAYFAALHNLHFPGQHVFTGQLTLVDIHTLQSWGLSLDFYATCMVLASLLFQLSYAAFSAILRDEVDLDQLREALQKVVQETMQPSHVSLWLKKTDGDKQKGRIS